MKKNFIIFLKFFITFCLIFLFIWEIQGLIKDYEIKKKKRQISILNHIMPRSFEYLVETVQQKKEFDPRKLKTFLYYYQKVIEYMPNRADAIGLTGFCFYHLGETEKAMASYKKAIVSYPQFFWYYYNLGMIHLEQKQYAQAVEFFKKGLSLNPEKTMKLIYESRRIYFPLISITASLTKTLPPKQLEQGYQKAALLVGVFNKYKNSSKNFKEILKNIEVGLQLF
ncbi:hypothetical protein MNBD_UNCLBAC01-669 [hydrothermal vent metagenome]|uniref:Uncharacterized protein n=1 Tax=hydrothermal vent metagenome TaxID=652676 RepID=A0A3B1D0E9_9ZZZZ